MRGPKVGEEAPDFTLHGVPPAAYRLSDQRGRRVVLAFYGGDFTPLCAAQLGNYQTNWDTFASTGAVLWAISVDDLEKHERFAKARALGFPLLADTEGEVSKLYGTMGLLGTSRRVLIIVGEDGRILHRKDELLSLTYTDMEQIVAHIAALGAEAAGKA
jgi:peroxiredoxin Q/BCP